MLLSTSRRPARNAPGRAAARRCRATTWTRLPARCLRPSRHAAAAGPPRLRSRLASAWTPPSGASGRSRRQGSWSGQRRAGEPGQAGDALSRYGSIWIRPPSAQDRPCTDKAEARGTTAGVVLHRGSAIPLRCGSSLRGSCRLTRVETLTGGTGSALVFPLSNLLFHALDHALGDQLTDFLVLLVMRVEAYRRDRQGCRPLDLALQPGRLLKPLMCVLQAPNNLSEPLPYLDGIRQAGLLCRHALQRPLAHQG